jgi:WD40 repeat protein
MDLNEEDVVEEFDITPSAAATTATGGNGVAAADDGEDELAEEEYEDDEEDEEEEELPEPPEPVADDSSTTFRGHTSSVYSTAWLQIDTLAVSGSGDDSAAIWDATSGAEVARLRGHTDTVVAVAVSHDAKYIATGSYDSTIRIWDSEGRLQHVVEGPSGEIEWIAWHAKVSPQSERSCSASCKTITIALLFISPAGPRIAGW